MSNEEYEIKVRRGQGSRWDVDLRVEEVIGNNIYGDKLRFEAQNKIDLGMIMNWIFNDYKWLPERAFEGRMTE